MPLCPLSSFSPIKGAPQYWDFFIVFRETIEKPQNHE
jgi:hypothetical protein